MAWIKRRYRLRIAVGRAGDELEESVRSSWYLCLSRDYSAAPCEAVRHQTSVQGRNWRYSHVEEDLAEIRRQRRGESYILGAYTLSALDFRLDETRTHRYTCMARNRSARPSNRHLSSLVFELYHETPSSTPPKFPLSLSDALHALFTAKAMLFSMMK